MKGAERNRNGEGQRKLRKGGVKGGGGGGGGGYREGREVEKKRYSVSM